MFDDTKYDVMGKEGNKVSIVVTFYLKVLHRIIDDYRKKGESSVFYTDDDFDAAVCDVTRKILPYLKIMAHLGYENASDLYNVDYDVMRSHFVNESVKEFERDYSCILNRYAKTLLINLILEEEKIDVASLGDSSSLLNLINGNTRPILKMLNNGNIQLSDNNKEVVKLMASDDFNIALLSSSQVKRLNEYHNKYMDENIYPSVSDEFVDDDCVIKQAKRLSMLGPLNR